MLKGEADKRKAYAYLFYRNAEEQKLLYKRDLAALAIATYDHGADLMGTNVESGFSGWRNILPAMPYLLRKAKGSGFDYLMVNQVSALGKNGRECIHTARTFAQAGIQVISLDGEQVFTGKAVRTIEEVRTLHMKKSRLPDM